MRLICFAMILSIILFSNASLAEENKLLSFVKNETNTEAIYNYINTVEWTDENLSIIKSLWQKDTNLSPSLPWQKLNNDIIRLSLANVLMQATRQCKIKMDMDELHDFVKSKAISDNLSIKSRASLLLGLAGYDEDIPFLSSIVKAEQEGYAEQAALSLTYIHSNAAVQELRMLNNSVRRPSLKKFLQDLVSQYKSIGLIECKH